MIAISYIRDILLVDERCYEKNQYISLEIIKIELLFFDGTVRL